MNTTPLSSEIEKLEGIIKEVEFLKPFTESLEKLKLKLLEGKLNVVFVGEFNSGKTSLINALFGLNLPTNVLPETASIWRISISDVDKPVIEINMNNGQKIQVNTFEEAKSFNPKEIKYIDVLINGDIDKGIVIVDTPGLSSLDPHHEEVLRNFIDEADVLLVVMDIEQGITKSLKEFIEKSLKEKRKTFGVITKADRKPEASSAELKKYILSQFSDFLNDVIITSAKEGRLEELRNLLQKIAQEKEEIIAENVANKLKRLCLDAREIVRNQIENADLDLSDINQKMNETISNIENLDREIKKLIEKIDKEIDIIADKASEVFINSLLKKVEWIADGLYDENLEETIEHRFDKAIKEATKESIEEIKGDIENLLQEIEAVGNYLSQKFDIGKNISITLAETVVQLRETISDAITLIASRIPKIGPVIVIFRDFIKEIVNTIIKGVTRTFVVSKIKEAILDPQLKVEFSKQIKNSLKEYISESYKEQIEELETLKESYKRAYEELKEEKQRRKEEFSNYIEKLKEINRKLTICGGAE